VRSETETRAYLLKHLDVTATNSRVDCCSQNFVPPAYLTILRFIYTKSRPYYCRTHRVDPQILMTIVFAEQKIYMCPHDDAEGLFIVLRLGVIIIIIITTIFVLVPFVLLLVIYIGSLC